MPNVMQELKSATECRAAALGLLAAADQSDDRVTRDYLVAAAQVYAILATSAETIYSVTPSPTSTKPGA
ncbi:hypothetical protein CH305_18390 [Rhodococcus sp. 15-649-2-2]|uniref:hypothetical protein n=1 Tax=Rhodococcus sp. 15-649-2-2 TaxID=2023140 RepID=UPI000B9A20DB|nr:hypothetical protein [Rhodococcus sp. 15-649-2-2]OZE77207.1 hypothetical protein CH305_18390 [Rhodococcus sp. 15-649-2-2]